MRASGDQLRQLTTLLDAGTIRPVVDRAFDFASTREALAHVEQPGTIGCRVEPRPGRPRLSPDDRSGLRVKGAMRKPPELDE
jgi:hypothetical protein